MSARNLTFLAGILAAASAACGVESHPSMTVVGIRGLNPDEDGCTMEDDEFLAGNTFDAAASAQGLGSYATYLEIVNVMPNNEDASAGRVNTARIQLTEIEVRFERSAGWEFLPESRRISAGAVIDSEGTLYYPIAAMTRASRS